MVPTLTTVTAESVAATKSNESAAWKPVDGGADHEDKLATVLFTSGSTGFAKGVEYTHAQLVTSSKLKCDFHQMDSSKTFLSWVSKYYDSCSVLTKILC